MRVRNFSKKCVLIFLSIELTNNKRKGKWTTFEVACRRRLALANPFNAGHKY